MDMDNEIARAKRLLKWLFVCGAIFLMSCCVCYGEIVYLFSGRKIEATVTNVYETVKRGRFGQSTGTTVTVEYSFTQPDGLQRTGSDTVDPNWQFPETGTVLVQYTSGEEGRSRLAGKVNWLGISLFTASVVALGVFVFRIWREAREATQPTKRKRVR